MTAGQRSKWRTFFRIAIICSTFWIAYVLFNELARKADALDGYPQLSKVPPSTRMSVEDLYAGRASEPIAIETSGRIRRVQERKSFLLSIVGDSGKEILGVITRKVPEAERVRLLNSKQARVYAVAGGEVRNTSRHRNRLPGIDDESMRTFEGKPFVLIYKVLSVH